MSLGTGRHRAIRESGILAAARAPQASDHHTRGHRPHDPSVLRLLDAILVGEHTVEPVDQNLLKGAVDLDRRYLDLQLGLADCIVMVLAQGRGQAVFTFDFRDFRAVSIDRQPIDLVVSEQ